MLYSTTTTQAKRAILFSRLLIIASRVISPVQTEHLSRKIKTRCIRSLAHPSDYKTIRQSLDRSTSLYFAPIE